MVLKFDIGSKLVLVCGAILIGSLIVSSPVMAQSGNAAKETPFIGFRPFGGEQAVPAGTCLLYTSPSPRDATLSRMPSSA